MTSKVLFADLHRRLFLGACGLKVVVDGMDREGLQDAMYKLLKEFLDTELGGITIEEWLGSAWDMTVMLGKIFLGHGLADKFNAFARWVAGKYGTQVGENAIYSGDGYTISLADGTQYVCGRRTYSGSKWFFFPPSNVTKFSLDTWYDLPNGWKFGWFLNGDRLYARYIGVNGNELAGNHGYTSVMGISLDGFYLSYGPSSDTPYLTFFPSSDLSSFVVAANFMYVPAFSFSTLGGSLSVDRAPSMSYMPELEADQGIALDVGAAGTMDETTVITGVLDDVLAGELAPTMEAVKEGTENPPVEEVPDVENLGLPALGEALTSRFPFSIPWDIAKAIRLLAAPEKAPYFEVDFLAPLADDVGGWQGSTAIVLDFSKYAIIGQLSRWTSTIGFCLALASGTKRLIWTA